MTATTANGAADPQEYPRAAYINGKFINIVARIWHAPVTGPWVTGAVSVNPSEPSAMALVAAWLRRCASRGKEACRVRPNFVISAPHHPVWERIAALWRMEMRVARGGAAEMAALADSDTVAAVATLGVTAHTPPDDVAAIAAAFDSLAAQGGPDVGLHVDAGALGFILPFTEPELKWDFRVPRVCSIATCAAEEGRMYPDMGWVVWRGPGCLPEGMTYPVNYLGLEIPQIGLNFSRPSGGFLDRYAALVREGLESFGMRQRESAKALGL